MLNRLLPSPADNNYRGHKAALWLFGLVAAINGVIGFRSIVSTRDVATRADGIALDTYSDAAAQSVLSLFAHLGVSRLVIFLLCILVLIRYRSLVPLLFTALLFGQVTSRLVDYLRPAPVAASSPGSTIILSIIGVTALGLALSLWNRRAAVGGASQ